MEHTHYKRIIFNDTDSIGIRLPFPDELDFWKTFGIDPPAQGKYNIVTIEGFTGKSKSGKDFTGKSKKGNRIYGYLQDQFVKIYKPNDEKHRRFLHLGAERPDGFIFGMAQLPDHGDVLIITGGEKDVVTLYVLGYPAITLNSETAILNPELLSELKQRFKHIIILYDNDDTGLKGSEKLSQEFGLSRIILPSMEGGKDISDFVKLKRPAEEFHQLVEVAKTFVPPPVSEVIFNSPADENKLSIQGEEKPREKQREIENAEAATNATKKIPSSKDYQQAEEYVKLIEEKKLDLTDGYTKWFSLARSLSKLGESGRELFHRISKFHPKYNLKQCDKQFSNCLTEKKNNTTLGTFFFLCHEAGIRITKKEDESSDETTKTQFQTPPISDFVKNNLPSFFKEVFSITTREREQDVAIIGSLILFSNILPNVFVIHDKEKWATHLYAFIAARAGTGKGILEKISKIFKIIDDEIFTKRFDEEMEDYKQEYKKYTEAQKNGQYMEEPVKPAKMKFFLSADSSRIAFLMKLSNNRGSGVMYDPEGDTLSGSLEMDWGNFSADIRKNFQQEKIESNRKEFDLTIDFPHFSILLSGTPNQIIRFFERSVEGGLFSRFIMYFFTINSEWDRTVWDATGWDTIQATREQLSKRVEFIFRSLEARKEPIIFTWQKKHWEKLNKIFEQWLHQYVSLFGENSSGIIYRLGLIASRVATILAMARMYDDHSSPTAETFFGEESDKATYITCSDIDYEITVQLMEVFKAHTFAIFEFIQKEEQQEQKQLEKSIMIKFLEALPDRFQRKDAIFEVASKLGIPERTADGYLSAFVKKGLLNRTEGGYTKTKR